MNPRLAKWTAVTVLLLVWATMAAADPPSPVNWGSLKARFAPTGTLNEFGDGGPWPFPYATSGAVADGDARAAMTLVGLAILSECRDVAVIAAPSADPSMRTVLVRARRADGTFGMWSLDLAAARILGELSILSTDLRTVEVRNELTGEVMTSGEFEAVAASEACRHIREAVADRLGIAASDKGWRDTVAKIRQKLNMLNTCERAMTIGGIVACGAASLGGPGFGIACGTAFWLTGAAIC